MTEKALAMALMGFNESALEMLATQEKLDFNQSLVKATILKNLG